jgi:hypothetical protein
MGFSIKNKKTGQKYYLKTNGHLYYFAKSSAGNVEKPRNMRVKYGRSGLPMLAKM